MTSASLFCAFLQRTCSDNALRQRSSPILGQRGGAESKATLQVTLVSNSTAL